MLARDVKPGSLVSFDYGDGKMVSGWCLGQIQEEPNHVLIGWKNGETAVRGAWPASSAEKYTINLMASYGCSFGYWIQMKLNVALVQVALVQEAIKSSGEACELCHDFAPMALPNCVNGTKFVCYSCRQGWVPPHLR